MPSEGSELSSAKSSSESILDLPPARLTPGMKQYQDVKKEHPDCLVMLRMGDFYEMFYQDAETAARELEITLTARGTGEKRAPLAGIPFHALDSYLGKLVQKGYKVAIVEQLEDPKLAKGLVKRGLVRIVTPGTLIDAGMLDDKENNYVFSLKSFGQQLAAAFCDISTGEFFALTIADEQALHNELARFRPKESLIPASFQVNNNVLSLIKQQGCCINVMEDASFSLEKSQSILKQHFTNINAFGLEPQHLAVSGALLHYLLDTQKNSLPHLQQIVLRNHQQMMHLDGSTLRNLELIRNIKDGSFPGTLLSVLDKTKTAPGARLLKSWIKQPLLSRQLIEQRLEAVDSFVRNMPEREELQSLLRQMGDLERLIGRVNYGNATPRDLLAIQQSVEQLPLLQGILKGLPPPLLQELATLDLCSDLAMQLKKAIRSDAPATIREGGIIQEGYSPELDELQATKKGSRQILADLEDRERQRTGISSLKLGFTSVFGYFLEVTKKNISLVPADYIRKQTTANGERYVTEELKVQEEKILHAQEKIEELEFQLFQDMVRQAKQKTKEIQNAAQKVAVTDVLCSLAQVASEQRYCRPVFVADNILQIRNGRHPVVEQQERSFVPNSLAIQPGEMIIITGPNMAGKSTVMRQTALIVLLAQMGSFVPADEVTVGIVDRIFTRVGAYDDLSSGQSTFMVEMQETAQILNNATEHSLIILDEIGRGTSTFDGVSIAWSVAEHLVNNIKAKTLFATHYHILNKLAEKFPLIKNYNVAAKEVAGDVILLHTLIAGGTDQSFGIHVAKIAGLPSGVVERAQEIQSLLEKDDHMMRKIKAKGLEEQKSLAGFSR